MANYYAVCVKPSCLWTEETLIDKRIDAHFYSIKYMQYYNKLMKCKIKKMSLYNICSRMNSGPFGSALLASQYVDKGVAFIRPLNCKDYIVDIDNDVVFISKEDSERLKSSKFSSGDLIFTKIGNGIGDVAIIPQKIFECNISGNLMGVKVKNNIDNYYVLTFLKSIYGQNQIWQGMMNSAKPKIDMDTLKSIVIPIPSPEIQKYIGDKVRKAEELREEAKRLKKEAEEILNKELNLKDVEFYIKQTNNKKYSWTESIEIEDRIDSEFYKPKYRYLSKLNNISELSYYYKISKKRINKNIDRKIKYIDLSSVNNIIEPSDFNSKELPSRAQFLVKEGNLIISTLKGSNKISIIPEHLNDSVCSTGFIVIASKSHLTTEYLYLVFSNKVFNMQIERYSTGSIMSGVNHDNFNKMLIPVISNKQIIDTITNKIRKHFRLLYYSKQLIQEAKQDVEDLIEGNFDMSKVKANN